MDIGDGHRHMKVLAVPTTARRTGVLRLSGGALVRVVLGP
jgi:hypothetical protein